MVVAGRSIRLPVMLMARATILMMAKRDALPDSDSGHALDRDGHGQQGEGKNAKNPGHLRALYASKPHVNARRERLGRVHRQAS